MELIRFYLCSTSYTLNFHPLTYRQIYDVKLQRHNICLFLAKQILFPLGGVFCVNTRLFTPNKGFYSAISCHKSN